MYDMCMADGACGFWMWVTILLIPVVIGIIWYCWADDFGHGPGLPIIGREAQRKSREAERKRKVATVQKAVESILVDMALAYKHRDLVTAHSLLQKIRYIEHDISYIDHNAPFYDRFVSIDGCFQLTVMDAREKGETWMGLKPTHELEKSIGDFVSEALEPPQVKPDPVEELAREIYEDPDEKDYIYKRL